MTEQAIDLYQVAEIELIYKNHARPAKRPQIKKASEAYEILLQHWDENKIEFIEQAKALLLNHNNRVLGVFELSSGGITGTVVDPRLLFVAALKANASGVILAHNHPSGNLKPSNMDRTLTEKIIEGGRMLDIKVMDHLIIAKEGFYSFSDDENYAARILSY